MNINLLNPNDYGRKLTCEELRRVKKGVEFGLELSWEMVLITAIQDVHEQSLSQE